MHRDLFDIIGIEIEIRPHLVVNPPRHNFPPPLGHVTDPG